MPHAPVEFHINEEFEFEFEFELRCSRKVPN